MMHDDWFTVQQIDSSTYAISEYGHWECVHSFLLLGTRKALLIDTGLGIDSMKRITDQLTTLPIIVVTTHVHWDHIGSHKEFEKIYVHEGDVDWLVNGIQGLSIQQIRADVGRDLTKAPPKCFQPETYIPFKGEPTGVLMDGDIFQLGDRQVQVIHTPGHSPGHIALHDHTYGYVFTGDLLYADKPIYAFYPSTSPEDLVDSWEKLTKISHVKRIFGSHYTLGMAPEVLDELREAILYLRKNQLVKFGTGIHAFKNVRVQF